MTNFVSSVPGTYTALSKLIKEAAAEQESAPTVFDFELGEYAPGRYITIHDIQGPTYEWESIGSFSQKETYEIGGIVTVFTGDSPVNRPAVAIEVLSETFNLMQACVMTPAFSHRTDPILGTEGPSPYLMLPKLCQYQSGPGTIKGAAAGWCGVLGWAFSFEALITPA